MDSYLKALPLLILFGAFAQGDDDARVAYRQLEPETTQVSCYPIPKFNGGPGKQQASGRSVYHNQHLDHATELPKHSNCYDFVGAPGFDWGTDDLIRFVENLGSLMSPSRPQILEMSHEHGGQASHDDVKNGASSSHGSGIDVDILYFNKNGYGPEKHYVAGDKVTDDFDSARNMAMLMAATTTGKPAFYWVDRHLKNDLCQKFYYSSFYRNATDDSKKLIEHTLALTHPMYSGVWHTKHDTHVHIRILCPKTDTRCEDDGNSPVPDKNGHYATGCDGEQEGKVFRKLVGQPPYKR